MKSVSGKNWEEIRINQRLIDKNKYEYQLNDIQAKISNIKKLFKIRIICN